MEQLLDWDLNNQFVRIVAAALVGAFIAYVVSEWTRVRRKKRLLMESAMLPSFVLTIKHGQAKLRMIGDYGIVNMSELPISLRRPHLFGYNLASRAFQFKVIPVCFPFEKLFEELSIPPNQEMVLISQKSGNVCIERFKTRRVPSFFWLETLEYVRVGSRKLFRWRARLYVLILSQPQSGEWWYRPTEVDIGSTKARLLALPGKLLFRYRERRKPAANGNGN